MISRQVIKDICGDIHINKSIMLRNAEDTLAHKLAKTKVYTAEKILGMLLKDDAEERRRFLNPRSCDKLYRLYQQNTDKLGFILTVLDCAETKQEFEEYLAEREAIANGKKD